MFSFRSFKFAIVALLAIALVVSQANWAESKEIKIGVLYELSGPLAAAGTKTMWGVEFAAELANNKYPDIAKYIPMAGWQGIPSIGGAKIKLIVKDTRAEPDRAANLAKMLIKDEGVIGIIGCRLSSVTKTASTVAERAGIPFLCGAATSPALTKRGYKWFVRTTPNDETFIEDVFKFLEGLTQGKARGVAPVPKDEIDGLGVACENTEWGAACFDIILRMAKKYKYNTVASLKYPHETPDLSMEAIKILGAKPNSLVFVPYLSDAILWIRTLKENKANPKIFWGQSGTMFTAFGKAVGKDANGILTRSVFVPKLADAKPVAKIVNELFKKRYGEPFGGASARSFTGMQAFVEALNIAGSTKPEAIRQAFNKVNIPAEQLVVPYAGVKFEDFEGHTGQNSLGGGLIAQYQGGDDIAKDPYKYLEVVYPFDIATANLLYPFPGYK